MLGTLKNQVHCFTGNFAQGEVVRITPMRFGSWSIASLDGARTGWAADFEVSVSDQQMEEVSDLSR